MSAPSSNQKYTIVDVDGEPYRGGTRAIGFVQCEVDDDFVNAEDEFEDLNKQIKKAILTGISQWDQGVPPNNRQHGWTGSQHNGSFKKCWVFKHRDSQVRVYAYLINPVATPNAMVCCIIHYDIKHGDNLNIAMMDKLVAYGKKLEIEKAAEDYWKVQLAKKEERNEKEKG